MNKILVTGATGQIGSELVVALRKKYTNENVIAVGHSKPAEDLASTGPFATADVTDKAALAKLVTNYKPDTIFHLVGILSAIG
jgi:nucleoside-diphosphate-sugar epimerase